MSGKRSASRKQPKNRAGVTTKPPKADKGPKYEYTDLNKASHISGEWHNFFGVVVDATFPYKTNKEKYVCSLKIVDASLHAKSATSGEHATLVIYANRFEDLPIVHRIGDIIRVHRAGLRIYKNLRQFNANIHGSSSWVLFSTDKKSPINDEE